MPGPKREKVPGMAVMIGMGKDEPMGEDADMGGEFEDEASEAFPDMSSEQMACLKRAIQAVARTR